MNSKKRNWFSCGWQKVSCNSQVVMRQWKRLETSTFVNCCQGHFFNHRLKKRCFMMHDLINDLTPFASGEFCCKFEHGKAHKILGKVRHFAYLMGKLDGAEKFEDLMKVRTLQTFLPLTFSNGNCPALSEIVSPTWLPENKHLRVLVKKSLSCIQLGAICYVYDTWIFLTLKLKSYLSGYVLCIICKRYCCQIVMISVSYQKTLEASLIRHLDVSNTNLRMMPPRLED